MKTTKMSAILVLGLMVCAIKVSEAAPMGTAFTYQGRLIDANDSADGLYDFEFRLFDDPNVIDSNKVGSTIDVNDVDVIDGYFTVGLDFGSDVFIGDVRWLDISVRPGDNSGAFTTISPRTEMTPVPYSLQTRGIFVDNASNVGIGTTSPNSKLYVNGGNLVVSKDGTRWSSSAALFAGYSPNKYVSLGGVGYAMWVHDATANNNVVFNAGNVGIGATNPAGKLDVNGSIYQRGSQLHADYVFEPGYELESIDEHSEFMWQNKHLSAIPKAKVDEAGKQIVEVGTHRRGIVEELEKAHIYIEQLHKQNKALEARLVKLEAGLNAVQ